jgi:hypothetical protein
MKIQLFHSILQYCTQILKDTELSIHMSVCFVTDETCLEDMKNLRLNASFY